MSTLLAGSSGVFKTQLVVDRIARSSGVEPTHYWQEITEHVEAMGGTNLDFICCDERNDAVICRLRWASDRQTAGEPLAADKRQSSPQEPAWQFNYSVPGKNGVRATLTSRGSLQNRLRGQRLIDLFWLFDTFCHSWTQIALPLPSLGGSVGDVAEPATILSMPRPAAQPAEPVSHELGARRAA